MTNRINHISSNQQEADYTTVHLRDENKLKHKSHRSLNERVIPIIADENFKAKIDRVQFFVSKDPVLLQQYYKLREEAYKVYLGFEKYNGGENQYDKTGDILLVVLDGKVIGGARLDFSNRNKLLYNEQPENNFFYKEILKRYDTDFSEGDLYAEICALVIRKDFRNNILFSKLYSNMVDRAVARGCKYLVGVSYAELCRHYERMFKKLGYNFKIIYDYLYPFKDEVYGNQDGVKLFPIFIKLRDSININ